MHNFTGKIYGFIILVFREYTDKNQDFFMTFSAISGLFRSWKMKTQISGLLKTFQDQGEPWTETTRALVSTNGTTRAMTRDAAVLRRCVWQAPLQSAMKDIQYSVHTRAHTDLPFPRTFQGPHAKFQSFPAPNQIKMASFFYLDR